MKERKTISAFRNKAFFRKIKAAGRSVLPWLGAVGGGMGMAFPYIYIAAVLPNLFLRVFVIAGTVIGAAAWVVWLLRRSGIRDQRRTVLLTAAAVTALYYMQWVLYSVLVEDIWLRGTDGLWAYHWAMPEYLRRIGRRFLQPWVVGVMMEEILYRGVLSVGGQVIRGVWLALLWVAEAGVLLALPLPLVLTAMKAPYDEEHDCWLTEKRMRRTRYIKNGRELRRRIREEGPAAVYPMLEELQPADSEAAENGKEAYGLVVFSCCRDVIGPCIELLNIRVSGTKFKRRQYIGIAEELNIGTERAGALYARLTEAGAEQSETDTLRSYLTSLWEKASHRFRKKTPLPAEAPEEPAVPSGLEESESVTEIEDIMGRNH